MSRMLVTGIGCLIMTDDGIGTKIAGSIKNKLQEAGIAVLVGETDVQYCLDEIRQDDLLFIVDAMMQGQEPGSILIKPLHDAAKSCGKLHLQHDFSLLDAVLLKYPEIKGYFIGIEAVEIGFGFELSGILRERFEQICVKVFHAVIELKEEARLEMSNNLTQSSKYGYVQIY